MGSLRDAWGVLDKSVFVWYIVVPCQKPNCQHVRPIRTFSVGAHGLVLCHVQRYRSRQISVECREEDPTRVSKPACPGVVAGMRK